MKIVIFFFFFLATQLSLAWKDAGKEIVQVYSRTEAHAQELAEQIGCDYTTSLDAIRKDADVYVFSVKDDALRGLIAAVCSERPKALFLHTAGSVAMDVFKGYASRYGVLYPMQTFSKHRRVSFLTNHCYRLAERVLEREQIDFGLFLPLIEETARKVKTMSPKDAQTGPMVRYDKSVMAMQMAMLPDERSREIYRLMAESIHEDYTSKD